jgi:hypothetical protein
MKDRSDHVNDLGHNRAWGKWFHPPDKVPGVSLRGNQPTTGVTFRC